MIELKKRLENMIATEKNRQINFVDLKAQQDRIGVQIKDRIARVLEHGRYIMGPEIQELEQALCEFTGAAHCVSCSSGTDALLMALMAYDVGPGDAIFTTPFTFISTGEVISLLGATPVFVDIEPDTFNIDANKLREKITALMTYGGKLRAKGIIPVDLFGQPADYDAVNQIAQEFDLFVLEDAAQAFGAEYRGKRVGNLADIAATSFFPAKPLGCYGDGGAVFCNDEAVANKLRSIRVHGKGDHKYDNARIGLNGRLDTLQAAILLAKLGIYEDEILLRQKVARRYTDALTGTVETPVVRSDRTSVWAQYSVLSDRREELMAQLKAKGIPSAVYYPKPLHLQTAYAFLDYKQGDFPVAEQVSEKIFSLPMHPYLEKDDQNYITQTINAT